MLLDIHSHILPGVDDGAESISESIKILKMMKSQGIKAVIATPHFDPANENKEQIKKRIQTVYGELLDQIKERNLPEVFLGYEVMFRYGMSDIQDLDSLTLAGTNKILIELPYGIITNRIITELEEIAFTRKLSPIIAHLERYKHCEGIEKIYDAIYNGVVEAQVTADTTQGILAKKNISKLLKKDVFTYLGSDAHSPDLRPPMVDSFLKFVKRYHGYFYDQLLDANKKLYKDMKKPTN